MIFLNYQVHGYDSKWIECLIKERIERGNRGKKKKYTKRKGKGRRRGESFMQHINADCYRGLKAQGGKEALEREVFLKAVRGTATLI